MERLDSISHIFLFFAIFRKKNVSPSRLWIVQSLRKMLESSNDLTRNLSRSKEASDATQNRSRPKEASGAADNIAEERECER